MTRITAIAAIAENNAIAKNGQLPWDTYPKDLQQYKDVVRNEPIIVGRRTYEFIISYNQVVAESCPAAVLTRDKNYTTERDSHTVLHSKDAVLDWVAERSENTVYNLGGGQIYDLFFEETDTLRISHIPVEAPNADVFFPQIQDDVWGVESVEDFGGFTVKTYQQNE